MTISSAKLLFKKIGFGPMLLFQGYWVRKKTPSLPEPVTQPQGICGSGKLLRLLVLGDSSAAGVGVDDPQLSLLGQLIEQLSPSYQLHYQLMAKTGQTTEGMLQVLGQQEINKFDVVITALGVNDVTAQVPLQKWLEQQHALISLITQKFSPRKIITSGLPPMREFPALPWPLNDYIGDYADVFNQSIKTLCDQYHQVEFLSLRNYPVEAQAASDGFHPGPKVYQLWAQHLYEKISEL